MIRPDISKLYEAYNLISPNLTVLQGGFLLYRLIHNEYSIGKCKIYFQMVYFRVTMEQQSVQESIQNLKGKTFVSIVDAGMPPYGES